MLNNDLRVVLAGIDLSYRAVYINKTDATVVLQYTDTWKEDVQLFEDSLKSVLKYEAIPIMILCKNPEKDSNPEDLIIVFEGLVVEVNHVREQKNNLNLLNLRAIKLTI